MSREAKLATLAEKRAKILAGGGEKRVAKQHESGKLTARERINALLDEGSFIEIDQFVTHRSPDLGELPGEGVVTGYGTIDGRLIYLSSQDFTVSGGSLGEMHADKMAKVMDLALAVGAPFIAINDSGGARIQEGIGSLDGFGQIFKRNTIASGVIPQISVILGPCAGGAVYSPAITDFIFMSKQGNMYITGPAVIKSVTGEEVSMEVLGGPHTHTAISGNAHFAAPTEDEVFNQIRRLLSFLPSNNLEGAPICECNDPAERMEDILLDIVPDDPNRPYDMKDIIVALADNKDFMEVQENFAKNMIIGFIRLNGMTVGVIANQPQVMAGCMDINGSDKAARFVRMCDAFGIPLLTLCDTPGFLPGVAQEHNGIQRHGAKLLYAFSEATVPKMTVITRKGYGGAYIAMCSKSIGCDTAIAWPSAQIAVMGAAGAVNILDHKAIKEAADPAALRTQKIAEYEDKFANPYCAAALGYVDIITEPEKTRYYLIRSLETLLTKKETRPGKKHGNIPL